jgi:HEPN domain-containing protein
MREADELRRQAEEWKEKAEEDFQVAVVLLKARDPILAAAICFHVQQTVEKYLKARLVAERIDFPRTHNIAELADLFPSDERVNLSRDEEDRLSEYAVVTRYPGEYDSIPLNEAEEALHLARRVRKYFRKKLAEDG